MSTLPKMSKYKGYNSDESDSSIECWVKGEKAPPQRKLKARITHPPPVPSTMTQPKETEDERNERNANEMSNLGSQCRTVARNRANLVSARNELKSNPTPNNAAWLFDCASSTAPSSSESEDGDTNPPRVTPSKKHKIAAKLDSDVLEIHSDPEDEWESPLKKTKPPAKRTAKQSKLEERKAALTLRVTEWNYSDGEMPNIRSLPFFPCSTCMTLMKDGSQVPTRMVVAGGAKGIKVWTGPQGAKVQRFFDNPAIGKRQGGKERKFKCPGNRYTFATSVHPERFGRHEGYVQHESLAEKNRFCASVTIDVIVKDEKGDMNRELTHLNQFVRASWLAGISLLK
jgi:hypothetical protein